MNATSPMVPPHALRPTAKALPVDVLGADTDAAAARSKSLAQNALDMVAAMRTSSQKALQSAGAAGSATLEAIRAAWAAIMAILRWIARVFNIKSQQVEKGHDGQPAPAMAASLTDVEAEVEASADEFRGTVDAAAQLPPDESLAFMKAMEAAGLTGADASFMKLVQDPNTLANSKAPTELMLAALNKSKEAVAALQPKLFEAQTARAAAAAAVSHYYSPPLNVEDLVSVLRATRGPETTENAAEVDALFAADDHLKALTAHIALIRESTLAVVASARQAHVDLEPHRALLDEVLGDSWEHRMGEVTEAMAQSSAAPKTEGSGIAEVASSVYGGLMGRLAAKEAPASDNADPAASAASFMAAAPKSAASRLRQAAADSAKFLPPGLNDSSGDDDYSSNSKPQA